MKFSELGKNFFEIFNEREGIFYLRSPGRVNLIGEHTDYNDGFVLPSAISLEIKAVFRKRNDSLIKVYSLDFGEIKEFDLKKELVRENSWIDYVKGVVNELSKEYQLKHGADVLFYSELPLSSGLSSSAAFELANAMIFSYVNNLRIDRKKMAILSQRAENNFVGVKCGIMDQFAVSLSKEERALFIDTKTLEYELIPLNLKDHSIVITNTNKKRELSSSEYNRRREECEKAVKILNKEGFNIESLRDIKKEDLGKVKFILYDETLYRRVKHVVEENDRVIRSVTHLKRGDLRGFGELMIESHKSLKDLYEVSCYELDLLVEEALKIEGTVGSRMTGAGFGGCTVSIVENSFIEEFVETIGKKYFEKAGLKADFYVVKPSNGVEVIKKE